MRILFANDGIGDAGGVQSYLEAVMGELAARGHTVALVHLDALRPGAPSPAPAGADHFQGPDAAGRALRWEPDVVFSHNMRDLEVEAALLARPVVKFMHGYFGTCVGGQKAHLFPTAVPCCRPLGAACLALYGPRRCGRLSAGHVAFHWSWAHRQKDLFARYQGLVVASEHMRREYLRNGAPADRVHAAPLFAPAGGANARTDTPEIVFVGRMTPLKGGGHLLRAASIAQRELGIPLRIVMVGDGPSRAEWTALAERIGVSAEFIGWADAPERDARVRRAWLAAVPSIWPEPFGLVGLEAAAFGVPSVAYDVGGIRDWLVDGVGGHLAPAPPTPEGLAAAVVRALRRPEHLAALGEGARAAAGRLTLARHVDQLEPILVRAAGVRS